MKFVDEFRDPSIARSIIRQIDVATEKTGRSICLMEVCGTHTMSIFRNGIKTVLPPAINLLSGPGCPVCVTPSVYIDHSIALSCQVDNLVLCTFSDMLNVPGSISCLSSVRAGGRDIRDVYSPLDALKIAVQNPDRQIVFMAVGFETTSPAIAATVMEAKESGLSNFSILTAHKLIPPAMKLLVEDEEVQIDGFICPAHVSAIIGSDAYAFLAEKYKIPCVVTGFEPLDILQGILMILNQIIRCKPAVEIQYSRIVKKKGNSAALKILSEVFVQTDSVWRGLGVVPQSGLSVSEAFASFDAGKRFKVHVDQKEEPRGCLCGDILKGKKNPTQCSLFRKACTPTSPVGPCMVSQEGTCAAYYKYGDN